MDVQSLKFHYDKLLFKEIEDFYPSPNKNIKINGFKSGDERGVADKIAIAGGAVRDLLTGEKVKDIDVFCEDEDTEKALLKFFKERSEKILKENSQLANFIYKGRWFQVIKGKYFNMQTSELIDSFDFTICCGMVTKSNTFFNEHFFEDCLSKRLRANSIGYPLSTLERMQKYIKKGYTACNGTLLELAQAIQEVDFENNEENLLEFYPSGEMRFLGVD